MRYNQFDFDYALESMDSVDLAVQANRLADSGDGAFADAVLEAYEDMYAALEAGDLKEAQVIYAALEEAEEVVEEDPDIARKAKRKAFMKKVGKGAAIVGGTAAAGAALGAGSGVYGQHRLNKSYNGKGGYLGAAGNGAITGAKYGAGIAAMTAVGKAAYNKNLAHIRAEAAKNGMIQEEDAQESYFDYYFGG